MRGAHLRIESFHHRKGEPVPRLDFDRVRNLFTVLGKTPGPNDELFINQDGLEKQIKLAPGDELQVFYYAVVNGEKHE